MRLRNDFAVEELERSFELDLVAAVTGMAPTYIRHALGIRAPRVSLAEVLSLLDLDAFSETFVPRSGIPEYLLARTTAPVVVLPLPDQHDLVLGSAYV